MKSPLRYLLLLFCLGFGDGFSQIQNNFPPHSSSDRQSSHRFLFGVSGQTMFNSQFYSFDLQGLLFSIHYNGSKNFKAPHWKQIWEVEVESGYLKSLAKRTNPNLSLAGSWGFLYDFEVLPQLHLYTGADLAIQGAGCYLVAYQNNPVIVNAHANIRTIFQLEYTFRARQTPVQLSYQIKIPLGGWGFSPDFGASFYEILNNPQWYKTHFDFSAWGNFFLLHQQLHLDFFFSRSSLSLSLVHRSEWLYPQHRQSYWHRYGFFIGTKIQLVDRTGKAQFSEN